MTAPTEDDFMAQARERCELAAALAQVSGGAELVKWFDDFPDFGDGEVIRLTLDRQGPSELVIALDRPTKSAVVTFELSAWIDVSLRGFSHQNVIGGLKLLRPADREVGLWEQGVGLEPGQWIIELSPCFGACGSIRANIERISIR